MYKIINYESATSHKLYEFALMVQDSKPEFPLSLFTTMSNTKRSRETILEILPLSKKVDINPNRTKFTDLNVDCLERIFDYLTLIDLFNVSDFTNSTLEAVYMIYSKRYSNYMFKICGMESSSAFHENDSVIVIDSQSICSKFLQNFGTLIKRLHLDFIRLSDNWNEIKQLINEKCTANLVELKLVNCDEETFAAIQNPLKNVTKLRISCSRLGKYSELDKWFPNLEQLELMHNFGCIHFVKLFPHLSYLAMDITDACLTNDEIKMMFKLTPQLKILSLHGGIDGNLLQYISIHLPNLKQLNLYDFHMATEQNVNVIQFKSIESLEIRTAFMGVLPKKVPFKFENLKQFYMHTETIDLQWLNFALAQRNLEILQLNSIWPAEFTNDHMMNIAQHLTQLREMDLATIFSKDSLQRLLKECKSLKKFRITKYNNVNSVDDSSWHITHSGRWLCFERKDN